MTEVVSVEHSSLGRGCPQKQNQQDAYILEDLLKAMSYEILGPVEKYEVHRAVYLKDRWETQAEASLGKFWLLLKSFSWLSQGYEII